MHTIVPHARVPVCVARNAAVSPQARCLYLILATYTGPDGRCWPSRRRLSADLGLSIRSVALLLAELERAGLLCRRQRRGRSTIFHLPVAPSVPVVPAPPTVTCAGTDAPGLPGPVHCAAVSETAPSPPVRSVGPDPDPIPVHCTEADGIRPHQIAETRATDCTGQDAPASLVLVVPGGTRAARCTGVGNSLHPGVQPASPGTISKNKPTRLLPEAGPTPPVPIPAPAADPAEPVPDPPYADPWSARTQYDPSERWPTLEQVRCYARRAGVPESAALGIWESYTAVGWVDRHGSPIRHWGAALTAAWRYREQHRGGSGGGERHPYPITHVTDHRHGYTQSTSGGQAAIADAASGEDPRFAEALALLKARWRRRQAERSAAH